MTKRPYSNIGKDPFGEGMDDFVSWVQEEVDGQRANFSDFEGVVNEYELEDLEARTKKAEGKMQAWENQEIALLGEWVVMEGLRNGWFGDAEIEVQPASKHDDYFSGIDVICEVQTADTITPLAIDVTTADAINSSNPLKASARIYNKINTVMERAKQGKHAGISKFFKSKFGKSSPVGHKEMLKAVVVVEPENVLRLAGFAKRLKEGDEDALRELQEDKFKGNFLGQIWAAVEHAQRMARATVRDQSKTAMDIEVASQIVSETEKLEGVIAKAGEESGISIDNELMNLIYLGTVPPQLLKAIKAEKLDELFV